MDARRRVRRDVWRTPTLSRSDCEDAIRALGATRWDGAPGLTGYTWSGGGTGPTVLLQHGYAEHAGRYVKHYAQLVPRLVAAGFDVYAFDMQGHGLSSGERGMTDIGAMVDAHLAARRSLAAMRGPLFLLGHSLGGLVTATSAARDPANVAGVILSSPALPILPGRVQRAALALLARAQPARGFLPLSDPRGLSSIADAVQAYVDDPMNFSRPPSAHLCHTSVRVAGDLWRLLASWSAPTIVFHGRQDSYSSVIGSELFCKTISSGNVVLRLFEDGYHELLNDHHADHVLTSIMDWMRELHGAMAVPDATRPTP